jgi:hypothetical protein
MDLKKAVDISNDSVDISNDYNGLKKTVVISNDFNGLKKYSGHKQ